MKNALIVSLFGLLLGSGTRAGDSPRKAQVILKNGDSRVGTYVSSPHGFETSSYWIEGPTGLIFIDTQFLLSAGEEALNWAEKTTGKKVELAIILHPNPDKFNGTATFQKRGIKVVTSEQVLAQIPAVHKLRSGWFFERYKPDYPAEQPKPESFGNTTQELTAGGGLKVKVHVLGAGCSAAHVVVEWAGHLFPGDLVTNGNHSWLELGLIDDWLNRIKELKAMKPSFVHPGRGPSGGYHLLVGEESYLKNVVRLSKNSKNPEKVISELKRLYPGYAYTHFIEIGIPEILAKKK